MYSITCYNVPMRYGFKRKLNIEDYTKNAAKNFSMTRLIIYTAISALLTILLFVTSLQYNYEGVAFIFTGIVFMAILGYTILNICAIVKKVKESK